jgi:hypothetical protein
MCVPVIQSEIEERYNSSKCNLLKEQYENWSAKVWENKLRIKNKNGNFLKNPHF